MAVKQSWDTLPKEAYDYWSKKQDKLGEYPVEYRDMNMLNKVPKKGTVGKRLV